MSGLAGFGTALMALGIWLPHPAAFGRRYRWFMICSVWLEPRPCRRCGRVSRSRWSGRSDRRLAGRTARHHAGRACRSQRLQATRPHSLAGVSDRAVLPGAPITFRSGGKIADRIDWLPSAAFSAGLPELSNPHARSRGPTSAAGAPPSGAALPDLQTGRCCSVALCLQTASGLVAREVIWPVLAFPGTILGSWIGARLYHALSDRKLPRHCAEHAVPVRQPSWSGIVCISSSAHGRHANLPYTPVHCVDKAASCRAAMSIAHPLGISKPRYRARRMGLLLGFVSMAIFDGTLPATRITAVS